MDCGIKHASGRYIVTMDGDGQNDPADIPALVRALEEKEVDVVSGCSLKIYRAECFRGISLFGEMHRCIPAVLKIKGFKIAELEVNHRPRRAATAKYTWKRGVEGLIDMLSRNYFQTSPDNAYSIGEVVRRE